MNLPSDFINNIHSAFGDEGREWLIRLPKLITEASNRWGLTDVRPVSNLSYNFVAFAKQSSVTLREAHRPPVGKGLSDDGQETLQSLRSFRETQSQDVVLKIGVPHKELNSELAALKLLNGNGACQLLESDEKRGLFLLERLKPGTMLADLEDDDERTHIAVDVMRRLWRPVESSSLLVGVERHGLTGTQAPTRQNFIQLSDWFDALKNIRPHFNGGTGPFPKKILERVESFLPELFADKYVRLMHGDLHHYNILKSERGWLAIDPKGVIGPVGYEIGPFMLNSWLPLSDGHGFKIRIKRRIRILSERLGWDKDKILQWATAHAVLSSWWSFQDGMDWEFSIRCAKAFSEIK